MRFMLSLRLKRVYLYFFGVVLLGTVFAVTLGAINRPEKAEAGGSSGTCDVNVYRYDSNPLSIYAVMTVSITNAAAGSVGPGSGQGQYEPWTPYVISTGINYFNTYSTGGSKTVYGRYHYTASGGTAVIPIECSRSFTLTAPVSPIGYADACKYVSGNTVIYGWAYDTDTYTGPSINTNLGNVGSSNIAGYRVASINSFIGSNFGDGAKDDSYGWTLTVPGLAYGGIYSLSGTIINVGQGTNVGLGVNTSVGGPSDLDTSYYGFPGGVIPPQCLPPPPVAPTCSLSVNPALVGSGGSSTLSWSTTTATSFSVDQGVGALSPVAAGSRTVFPGASTKTYTGSVSGPGGSANCSTTLNVGSVGCSLNSILAIEPGETYQPRVTISYVGGAASFGATTTVTISSFPPNINIISPAPVAGNTTYSAVAIGSPILFNTPGNYTVTSTTSGTVNGVAYGPIDCTGGSIPLPYVPVVKKPYFKVFGGGLTVGSGFNSGTTTCTTSGSGQVSAFASNSPSFHGASTQYDLKALSPVATTFYSSGGRQPTTPNFKALTLANNVTSGTYGGNFGGTSCITDYYSTTKQSGISSLAGLNANLAVIDGLAGLSNQIESSAGATITGGTLGVGGKLVIYVTGDVYISGSITLATTYTNGVSDIPFFALVVRGNIKIAPGVTTLEGLYIAQPNGATGGTVYTCLNADNSVPNLFALCGTKLTFNGSVVAKSIKLLRTAGTLFPGIANETTASTNIAEVFNGMPELYIANPAFKIDDTATELYDSVTSLPPLL